jgi:hypothetical protein
MSKVIAKENQKEVSNNQFKQESFRNLNSCLLFSTMNFIKQSGRVKYDKNQETL